MIINAHTKIAGLLKHHPGALEAIVSISPKFVKLRNPILRKVIATRTSIAMAAKLGGCTVEDFFNRLQPLGFEIDKAAVVMEKEQIQKAVPAFFKNIAAIKIVELDVRPVIESGKDPLDIIVKKVKSLETGAVLKIINSFEPTPLMHLLGKQGFECYAEPVSDDIVNTYFYKKNGMDGLPAAIETGSSEDWEEIMDRFKDKLVTINVSEMEMPLPMHAILEALEALPEEKALFVYHKRIPVFLLPELEEQQFNYRIREISDAVVHLLIYKN